MKTLPAFSVDLVEELARLFPARCIRPGETPEEAHRYAGKVELVEFLTALAAKTDQTGLDRLVR